MWAGFGFDSGISGSFWDEPKGMGIHWSTLAQMCLMIYVLMVSFHVNGLKSFKQFYIELKRDFKYIFRWRKKPVSRGQKEYRGFKSHLGSFRALFISFCASLFALFLFEIPWTIFYNYFQFNDIWFPIYYYSGEGIGMFRNFVLLIMPIWCIYFAFKLPSNTIMKLYYSIQIRFDKYSLNQIWYNPPGYKIRFNKIYWSSMVIMLAVLSFGLWIDSPQSDDLTRYYATEPEYVYEDLLNMDNWTFPIRDKFPQTIYTFYVVSQNTPYTLNDIGSYWLYDDVTHFWNVLTKTLFFLAVTMFFIIEVKERK